MWLTIKLDNKKKNKDDMSSVPSKYKDELKVSIKDFNVLGCLGQGTFSVVRHVKHKKTGKDYAMKVIEKKKIRRSGAIHGIIYERSLLENIESPFISNLRYAFQDAKNLFMVLDFLPGGDLRQCMKYHKFTEIETKNIFSEIACGMEYIHKHGIIHRDIKPENIMFDMKGNVYIIDFNVSTIHSQNEKAVGAAGSSNYMAPEILNGDVYDECIDWWSLGIVTYEMTFGSRPFMGNSKHQLLLNIESGLDFNSITEKTSIKISKNFKTFLLLILEPEKEARLGAGSELKGLENIMKTSWLKDQDWNAIMNREHAPLFVPKNLSKSDKNKKLQILDRLSMYGFVGDGCEHDSTYGNSSTCKSNDSNMCRYTCAFDVLMGTSYKTYINNEFEKFVPYMYSPKKIAQ